MSNKGRFYEAPWDERAKLRKGKRIWILFFLVVFSLFGLITIWIDINPNQNTILEIILVVARLSIIITIYFIGDLILHYLLVTRGFTIHNDKIVILRNLVNKNIPFSEIQELRYIKDKIDAKSIPLIKIGVERYHYHKGYFGYSPNVFIKGFGKVHVYANRWSEFVMILTEHYKPYLLAPDDPHEFIKELQWYNRSEGYGWLIRRRGRKGHAHKEDERK